MAGKVPMWRRYLRFWGQNIDADIGDEMAFHVDERTRELIDAGWDPGRAREEAQRLFGDARVIVSECRRIDRRFARRRHMTQYFADLGDDVRFAFRQIRRYPKYWAVIGLTLVVGIAATTSLFATVDGVLLKPLPYPDSHRLVRLTTWNLRGEYVFLRDRAKTLDVAAYYPTPREVTVSIGGRPARLPAAGVTSDLFQVLGVKPVVGRSFTADEMRVGAPGIVGGTYWRTYGVVILSAQAWRDYFDESPAAVGSRLLVEGVPHTVVGVMPAGFHFPLRDIALWFPHNIDPATMWNGNVAVTIGRLRPGWTLTEARAEVRALVPTFVEFIPWARYVKDYGRTADVQSLEESVVGDARRVLLVLLAAIGVVLLVVCVNVANLLLARGITRDREMTTRAALGAGRARLARQVIVENLTVAIVSGAVGLFVTWVSLRAIVNYLPADLPRTELIAFDSRVFLFALGVSTLTGLAFGLLPVLRATRAGRRLMSGLRGFSVDPRERRLPSLLAALEFAFAVMLVASAVLLLRSLWNLTAIDPGFRMEHLVSARISPPGLVERGLDSRHLLGERVLDRLGQIPGVQSAALANAIPFDVGLYGTVFTIDGRTDTSRLLQAVGATYTGVTAGYFATMGVPIVQGRVFTEADGPRSARVAVISRRAAKVYWGDESPIGARIRFRDDRQFMIDAAGSPPVFTVVGVVGDVRFANVTGEPPPLVYVPLDQFWDLETLRVVVRTTSRPEAMAQTLRAVVSEIDPATPVSGIQTVESRLGETIARPRFAAYLLGAFAAVALFLAAIGTYGVLSHAVSRRLAEIGVRLALGASGPRVFGLVFGHGVRIALAGVLIGIPAAIALTRSLTGLLVGVDPLDPRVFGAVSIVLLLIGVAVSYVPARRATRIDPMIALRSE